MIVIVLLLSILPSAVQAQTLSDGTVVVTVRTGKTANLTYPAPVSTNNLSCYKLPITPGSGPNSRYGMISNPDGSVSFTISQVTKDDRGKYACTKNGDFTTLMIFSLVIVDPLLMSLDQTIYNLNDRIVVQCSAVFYVDGNLMLNSPEDFKLLLILNGRELWRDNTTVSTPTSTRNRSLTFTGNVLEEMKTNNITCVFTNDRISESVSQRVFVTYPPTQATFDKSGSTFNPGDVLTCGSDGYPPATVTWNITIRPSQCPTPPQGVPGPGYSSLTLTDSCLGLQTWLCTASWTANGNKVVSNNIQFTVVGNNSGTRNMLNDEAEAKKKMDIGLGVGLGLGIPLLILIIALILVFCCGVGRSSDNDANKMKKSKPPPTTTTTTTAAKKAPLAVVSSNPKPYAPPNYNQVAANGSPGVPDIGFGHLSGSGSNPVLNSSLDGPNFNPRSDRAGVNINLGKADLGVQNRSFTNI